MRAAALLAALAVSTFALADEDAQPACAPTEAVIAHLAELGFLEYPRRLTHPDSIESVRNYFDRGREDWTEIVIANGPNGSGLIMVGRDGGLCRWMGLRPSEWHELMDDIIGDHA